MEQICDATLQRHRTTHQARSRNMEKRRRQREGNPRVHIKSSLDKSVAPATNSGVPTAKAHECAFAVCTRLVARDTSFSSHDLFRFSLFVSPAALSVSALFSVHVAFWPTSSVLRYL